MKARDLFGVSIRIAGLVFFVFAMFDSVHILIKALHLPDTSQIPVSVDIVAALTYLVLTALCLLAANPLVRLTYGSE